MEQRLQIEEKSDFFANFSRQLGVFEADTFQFSKADFGIEMQTAE